MAIQSKESKLDRKLALQVCFHYEEKHSHRKETHKENLRSNFANTNLEDVAVNLPC